jgi:membrane fusion protein (multidrug efflux system)
LDSLVETTTGVVVPIAALRNAIGVVALAALSTATLGGCKGTAQPQKPPPTEVTVIRVTPSPVTVYHEYVGQTQAPATIEIRAQVTGLLERQAFTDGQRVNRGDLLYVIDPRPFLSQLDQANANLAVAQANLTNARNTLERYQRLVAQRAVSQQEFDTAQAQEKAAAANVEAQRALVRDAKLNLNYTHLEAPREGFMSNSLVRPGSLITAQQTLLDTLYSSDPMWVNFTISEDRLLELQKRLQRPPGDRPDEAPPFYIRLTDGTQYHFPGKLDFVDVALDQKSGTLQIRVSLPNPERVLRPNLFVRVIVPAYQNPNAIRIPQQAVTELQGLKNVFVVTGNNIVQMRQIAAPYRTGNDWVVQSGLQPGEMVVVEGVGKIKPNAPVRPVLAQQQPPAQPSQAAASSEYPPPSPVPSTTQPPRGTVAPAQRQQGNARASPAPAAQSPSQDNTSAAR